EKNTGGAASVADVLFEYDGFGNVSKSIFPDPTDPTGNGTLTAEYTSDALGRVLQTLYPDRDGQDYGATAEFLGEYLVERVKGLDGRASEFTYNEASLLSSSDYFDRDGETVATSS